MKNYNTELPTWLPDKIKKVVEERFFSEIKNEECRKIRDKKWKFVRILFENSDLKTDWEKLSSYSEEDINLFIFQIFELPHSWKQKLELEEKKEKHEKNLRKNIEKFLKAKKDLDKSSLYTDWEIEDPWKLIESRMHERLFEMDKKHDTNYADYYFLRTSPLTRKKNVQNAHALYCMKCLSLATRISFKKPLNEVVANFTNAIFDTEYTYIEVLGYTKDIKNVHDKLNDVTTPFASTVNPKTGKIRLIKSVDSET